MRTGGLSAKSLPHIGAIVIVVGCPALAASRTEHGSFLEQRAKTPHQLVLELSDRRVLDRYERHFGLTKQQLQDLFRSLRVERLKRSGPYVVYNADKAGRINWKNLKLRKGTLVFGDPFGAPVLKFSCGNPMKPGSDHIALTKGETNLENASCGNPQDQLRQLADATQPTLDDLAAGAVLPEMPSDLEVVQPTEPLFPTGAPMSFTAGASSQGLNFGSLLAIGGLGALPLTLSGSHTHKTEPIGSTPEPAPLAVLGCGAGLMIFRRTRRKAKNSPTN